MASTHEIDIYGDGSFNLDLMHGAWAANIPSFGLQIVGTGCGPSAGHFEFYAIVEGIRAVVRVDHTTRQLHLHTDSDYVIGALRFLPSKAELPARKTFDSIRSAHLQGIQLLGARPVHWSRADTRGAFHRICHNAARSALRRQLQSQLASDSQLALVYEQRRRENLLRAGDRLMNQMIRLEDRLQLCDDRIAQHLNALDLPMPVTPMSTLPGTSGGAPPKKIDLGSSTGKIEA